MRRTVVLETMAHPRLNAPYFDITSLKEPLGMSTQVSTGANLGKTWWWPAGEKSENSSELSAQNPPHSQNPPRRGPPEMVFNVEVAGEYVLSVILATC